LISLILNADLADEDTNYDVQRGNKVTFKKDQAEIMLGWTVELMAKNDNKWEKLREGYIIAGVSAILR
jgi:hypothetical protein